MRPATFTPLQLSEQGSLPLLGLVFQLCPPVNENIYMVIDPPNREEYSGIMNNWIEKVDVAGRVVAPREQRNRALSSASIET